MKAFAVILLVLTPLVFTLAAAHTYDATVVQETKSDCVIPTFEFEYKGVTYCPLDVCPLAPDTVGTLATHDGFVTVEEKPPILGVGKELA
ncbi:hypothetical protein [Runella sp. SP2]|uniref:hypothetical protein n=1 Tax=Runella sp. SP2 TaxID=2268026 RepID=UPI000F0819A1|nr:hypothetical protein [Runella sp. SP2]AYQ31425.1 hypothetical protein DTQ70_04175 [Runella sp. SP2]